MSDITYTAQGTFDRNAKANILVCIPAESPADRYKTQLYNLSKISSSGTINAIFCHFSNKENIALNHDSFDYRMNFDIKEIQNHSGAVDFNEFSDDALFLFFHNDEFKFSDRQHYYDRLEEIYNDVKHNGNQSQEGLSALTGNEALNNPRRIGMSLVTRLTR